MQTLLSARARDIMETDLVELKTLTPIESAISTLEEYAIHGAPVVDEAGQFVGVLSVSDILRRDQSRAEETPSPQKDYYALNPFDEEKDWFAEEDYSVEVLGRELVADWMTPSVISVGPDDTLDRVCDVMVKERVHRLFVVEDGRVVGLISTFDIVKRLASAAHPEN